jgi:hypothetical protein
MAGGMNTNMMAGGVNQGFGMGNDWNAGNNGMNAQNNN